MRYFKILIIILVITYSIGASAQSPGGKTFGFGIVLGEPTGVTAKLWTERNNALVFDLGASYFGSPRIGIDYLWHFNAFRSNIVNLYAGPGAAIGFGEGKGFWYKHDDGFIKRGGNDSGLGVRGVFGINVLPERTPLEIFFEIGTLVGLVPEFGAAIDAAVGIRFYP